ncbi:uncharacterized protein PpBr36_09316 [Pyricularia pennisetigena]|uniref:uncharacterized protein n=1 Tax=Pyricularia pennisetigena TaxID=1578925 RepID=UPI00114FC236|nr:uncharacterized protein PpBr36_09316 [Pyricularia pennisetigena]TLS21882.1 hypothetical protein PpBr36_09316 [Pyricularia pennisetigena]
MSNNIPGRPYPNATPPEHGSHLHQTFASATSSARADPKPTLETFRNVATASNPYQTNIGRSKTKKWVTAPRQNYDGDDWGNDFDDEPEEPAPPLPGQGTGRHEMSQATDTAPDMRSSLPSAGTRNLSGPPSLQLQTQQSTGRISPGALPSDKRRSFTSGGLGGPAASAAQSPVLHSAPAVQSPPPFSNLPSRQGTTSPTVASPSSLTGAPPSTRATENNFPARKSSLDTKDGPLDLTSGPRRQGGLGSPSDSRPASGHVKPWMEPRSASPQGPRSPPGGVKSPTLIRPSDIYRRMEEEKEKKRQSLDSSRPSVDSATGRPGTVERAESPAIKPPVNLTDAPGQSVRSSSDKENATAESSGTGVAAGLPTVAERKSEYGLDGFASGSGSGPKFLELNFDTGDLDAKDETENVKTASNPTDTATGGAASAEGSALASHSQKSDKLHEGPQTSAAATAKENAIVSTGDKEMMSSSGQDAKRTPQTDATQDEDRENELRRYSSSPKLPDFARMSSFGFDFLSTSAKDEDKPPVPVIAKEHEVSAQPPVGLKATTEGISKLGELSETKKERQNEAEPQHAQASEKDVGNMDVPKSHKEEGTIGRVSPALSNSSSPTPGTNDINTNANNQSLGLGLAVDKRASAELARKVSQRKPVPSSQIEPVARTGTMDTAAAVKESDKLTDEIIKSLSPQVAASDTLSTGKPPGDSVPRESAYLGDVYDYYGSFDEKAAEEEEPVPQKKLDSRPNSPLKGKVLPATPNLDDDVPDGSMSPKPLNTHKKQSSVDAPTKLRQRFSWEADQEQVNSPSNPDLPALVIPTEPQANPEPEPKSLKIIPPNQSDNAPVSSPISPARDNSAISPISSGSPNLERQISESSMLAPESQTAPFELPSPISALSDNRDASVAQEQNKKTLAEEKEFITTSTSPVEAEHPALSPTATTDDSRDEQQPTTPINIAPGLASIPLQSQTPESPRVKIWTFREIMALPTSEERVERMIETRNVFAKLDSGLAPWIDSMTAGPEHANASSSLKEDVNNFAAGQGETQRAGGTAAHLTQPQPYYQQYVNASNTNLATSGGGETTSRPLSGTPNLSQLTSEFRHSGGQVGAKGKEFLKSAGKAGKGLFSKGKSKFQTAREEWK